MRYTLLEMTQRILSSLSSDEVSSISDTVEALQVVDIIEAVFYNIIENEGIRELEDLVKIEGLSSSARPNYLKLPNGVARLDALYYNISETGGVDYRELKYLDRVSFIRRMNSLDDTLAEVDVISHFDNTKFKVRNDEMPRYYTVFDDEYLVVDSFKSSIDSTLQASKTMAIVKTNPTFNRTDTYVPQLDDNLFPLLLNEAKSWAHLELKQQGHAKAEQQARRQRTRYQKERSRITKPNSRPDYGRR